MKYPKIIVFALVFVIASPLLARAGGQPVREDLAAMVEEVVAQTRISIHVSESTSTSATINQVNGRSVCSVEARPDVARLQRAFDAHRSIYRNFGPVLTTITDRAGKKTHGDRSELEKRGLLKGCSHIYISVHE